MKYKQLGRTGLKVSALSLGTLTIGTQLNETDSISLIKSSFAAGVNLIDTSDTYGDGKSEEAVGKAIKGERDAVLVASKVGRRPGPRDFGTLSRRSIMQAVEGSLSRLQTDYIDLYYAHVPDYVTPLEETLRAMDDLVRHGKVRYIGCSNFHAWRLCKSLWLSELHNLTRFECVQPVYNLLARDMEYELVPLCVSEGIGICVFNPLAGELLTGRHAFGKPPAEGRLTLASAASRYLERYWSETNFNAVDQFKNIAHGHGCTMAQFSMAWILNNSAITSVISGYTSVAQLNENLQSVDIVLSDQERAACDAVWEMFRPRRHMYAM